jgi:dihydroorotate dehydrogenase electron transfer subunit
MPTLTLASPNTSPARRGIFNAPVVEHRKLCREHYLLRVRATAFPATLPGQFVQIGLSSAGRLDLAGPTLRRPFSIAGRQDTPDGTILDFIYRVVGQLTGALEKLSPGDSVNLLGPLGQPFPVPQPNQTALLIGGGVGIPPMIYLASHLCAHRGSGTGLIAFAGATTRDLLSLTVTNDAPTPTATSVGPLYNIAEFSAHGVPAVISTDDGSYGFRGYITDALEAYLSRYFSDSWEVGSVRPVVYTCGPEIMMKKIADIAARRGLTCYAAVERAMACGLGTCQSCVIRVKAPNSPDGWRYALSCTEGPVFDTRELLW